jgi:AcrR family transcriptional regulator
MNSSRPYHHGDLRRALLDAAAGAIAEHGAAALSLRDLARRAGVSHAAPAHHFGDKTGLLTALAAEGYELLGRELGSAWDATGEFLEVGVAYVRFALAHPAHFAVMFEPRLLRMDDPGLARARSVTRGLLYGPAGQYGGDAATAGIAAWSLTHGLATLLHGGNIPAELAADPEALTRAAAANLFGPPGGSRPA